MAGGLINFVTVSFKQNVNWLETIKVIAPYVVAIIGIISGWIIPHLTKNIEFEKNRNQFLYEKKYNAYVKYLSIIDKYLEQSQETVLLLHGFKGKFENKEKFEKYKQILIASYRQFSNICSKLSMPGLEVLIFVNKEIQDEIKKIVEFDTQKELIIDSENDYFENASKVLEYVKVLSRIADLLKTDLRIGEIN